MVPCDSTKVTVQDGVAAECFLVVSRCYAFMVEVVVDAAAVPTLGHFVAGHAYVSEVSKLKAVLAD